LLLGAAGGGDALVDLGGRVVHEQPARRLALATRADHVAQRDGPRLRRIAWIVASLERQAGRDERDDAAWRPPPVRTVRVRHEPRTMDRSPHAQGRRRYRPRLSLGGPLRPSGATRTRTPPSTTGRA